MSKLLKVAMAVTAVFALLMQPVSASDKTTKFKVTLVGVELVENNHVGNEWLTKAYVNGKEVQKNKSITLSLKSTDSIKLKAYAEEQDKIPDSNSANDTVKASSITKTVNKALKVVVTENRGRFSGNTAEWKFTYKIEK
ncbi:hypothetical protein PghCCS26_60200 [Paenibacillus glycanilyticus]|uniref:Uncharacterized protein n=1 Tax=Paenibacillus glycanilyticus TaxID=126569 RepID=A0ABQ6NUX3_9BACL|nr:hypothetical protein [Paenibacillus glycanilyticus]GMK48890.1 hypothetical protein PghCCS26_60200 [Paenibacillus glycanilyticus]